MKTRERIKPGLVVEKALWEYIRWFLSFVNNFSWKKGGIFILEQD
jgi:hypothetical protein